MNEVELFDAVGIGIGPSNLSLAALLEPLKDFRAVFLERRKELRWHPGLMLPAAEIQVSHLKDLVTLVDPTSRFSFLSFLSRNKRLYRFINAGFPRVKRTEFEQYLRWVAEQLGGMLQFDLPVDAVTVEDGMLAVHSGLRRLRARHLVLGTGLAPFIPSVAERYEGPTVFHASQLLEKNLQPAGKRIAVIGGGQTGAEVALHLLSFGVLPSDLFWISRRHNFFPLDESPFVNDLFTPSYSNFFFSLPREVRERLIKDQKLASDGISVHLLETIYRRLYELEFLERASCRCRFWPGRELKGMSGRPGDWSIELFDEITSELQEIRVDAVILCTGYSYSIPRCLDPIRERLDLVKGEFQVNEDFSICWDGPADSRIYVQNAARNSRGIADPNLSLIAWRSSKIANSLAGRKIYDSEDGPTSFGWCRMEPEALGISPSMDSMAL